MPTLKGGKFVALLVGVVLLTGTSVYAATSVILNDSIETVRYSVGTSDFLSGTYLTTGTTSNDDIVEYKLFTLGAGDQILSFVSNVKEAFSLPNDSDVSISYIRAMQGVNIISECDLGHTVNLTYINFERKFSETCHGYGFFDENNPVDIVVGVQAMDASDISLLESNGAIDFIVTLVK